MVFIIGVVVGAIAGSLVTAVYLLDHHKHEKKKWWE